MPIIGLDGRSNLTVVYRKVEAILRNDAALSRAVDSWITYGDRDPQKPQPAPRGKVAITLWPTLDTQDWESPDSHTLALVVEVTMIFDSGDAGDYLDVWFAVQRALYPATQAARLVVQQELRALGAQTGEPTFQSPSADRRESTEDGRVMTTGLVRLAVRLLLNA